MAGASIKTSKTLVQGMINFISLNTSKITDFNPGSVVRTLVEAVSLQLEEFYYALWKNFTWALENSVFDSFGFSKIAAVKASTTVRVTFKQNLAANMLFPKGTRFIRTGESRVAYLSTAQVVAPTGSGFIDIPVECTVTGVIGNCAIGAINAMATVNTQVQSVSNLAAAINGREDESKQAQKDRFHKYISAIARGTEAALQYGALEVADVKGAYVDSSEIGIAKVYIHGQGGVDLPSSKYTEVKNNLNNYRAAGIEVQVKPVVKVSIPVTVTAYVRSGYDLNMYKTALEGAVEDFFESYVVGKSFHISELIQFFMNYDPNAVAYVTVALPLADYTAAVNELVVLGTKTINVTSYAQE